MAPEIYFSESIGKPVIWARLYPEETSKDILPFLDNINKARNQLKIERPDYQLAGDYFTEVLGKDGAKKIIEAYKERKPFRMEFKELDE